MRCRTALLSLVIFLGSAAARPAATAVRLVASLPQAARPGMPILLVFFSTECSSCYGDLFDARLEVESGGFDLDIVGVSAAPAEELRAFLLKFGWDRPVVQDRRKTLFRRFRVDVLPFKVLLIGGEAAYRDDPYRKPEVRWRDLRTCLKRLLDHRAVGDHGVLGNDDDAVDDDVVLAGRG